MEDANTCGGEEGNQISKRGRRSLLSDTQKTKEEDKPFWKEKNESTEEEACGEVAGCTGEEGKRRRKHFLKRKKKKMFFFLKYINFYFLNEGYFWKFIQLLGALAILLGAPSNTLS